MNSKYGLYLYASSNIFPKVKSYIANTYHTINVQGVSEYQFFERDFLTNPSSRNLRSIAIINTQKYTPELNDQYTAMVTQINALQSLLSEKLIVTVLYVDDKILSTFAPLRRFTDLNLAHIGAEGIKNDIIDKIIVAPILKDAPNYVEGTGDKTLRPAIQSTNPNILPQKEPISVNVAKQIDVDRQFEANSSFNSALRNISEDLKNMELRMDVSDWTHQELESALESLGSTDSLSTIDDLLKAKTENTAKVIESKVISAETELESYRKSYEATKDANLGEQVSDLVVYREGLNDVKEICEMQNKGTLYRALQSELITKSNETLSEFKASMQEIEDLKSIKDSKQRIEQMKTKRIGLIKSAQSFKTTTMRQYNAIEAEVSAQEKLLITQATTRKENYEGLQSMFRENNNEKLKNQLILDREILVTITKEIRQIQESKKAFMTQFGQIMRNYEGIISLDTNIQHEYEILTNKLESTKRVVVEAKDNLGTKLEVFVGPDGAGKTCVAVNYAESMAKSGKSVCIIDLDTETPELQYYTEAYKIQDIAEFIEMECSVDGLSQLDLQDKSCYIINNFYGGSLSMRLDSFDSLSDIYKNVLDKLTLLSHVFDKIIVIARSEVSEFTNELYSRCGKWYYVTDLNTSNLAITEGLIKSFKAVDSTTYYRVVLNKFVQTEMSNITQRLNINTAFNPIKIQFSHALTLSKLDGVVACASNNAMIQIFNFK